MAGRVVVSTLNDDTGVLATQNGMTGVAKAWVNYNGIGTTIRGAFNVSSVTLNSAGDYTLNFTTAMPNTNYVIVATTVNLPGNYTMAMSVLLSNSTTPALYSTTACRIQSRATDSSLLTLGLINAAVFSS